MDLRIPLQDLIMVAHVVHHRMVARRSVRRVIISVNNSNKDRRFTTRLRRPTSEFRVRPRAQTPQEVVPRRHHVRSTMGSNLNDRDPVERTTGHRSRSCRAQGRHNSSTQLHPLLRRRILRRVDQLDHARTKRWRQRRYVPTGEGRYQDVVVTHCRENARGGCRM